MHEIRINITQEAFSSVIKLWVILIPNCATKVFQFHLDSSLGEKYFNVTKPPTGVTLHLPS